MCQIYIDVNKIYLIWSLKANLLISILHYNLLQSKLGLQWFPWYEVNNFYNIQTADNTSSFLSWPKFWFVGQASGLNIKQIQYQKAKNTSHINICPCVVITTSKMQKHCVKN